MTNFKTTVIEKCAMEDMNWEIMLPKLEAKSEISNIALVGNRLTYDKTTELIFEASSLEEAQAIAAFKTKILSGVATFKATTEEILDITAKQESKKLAQNPAKKEALINVADAENYLYEMDMNNVDELTIKEGFNQITIVTRADVLKALPHIQ